MFRLISCLAVLVGVGQVEGAIDTFGTGSNQFTITFVPISGSTNPTFEQANAWPLDGFGIVNNDYRMGVHEITNDQWDKFKAELAPIPVAGYPPDAYNESAVYTGTDIPTDSMSWYEAAQFVNWLNTSTNHHAAYNFTGTQGVWYGAEKYTLATWTPAEAAGGTNLYRHKDAFYFLPTEDEWVKAAYWNGTTLQDYATKAGESLFQGDGSNGGWNYWDGHSTQPVGPWDVGSGSEELNGTFDMMGNVREWMESPISDTGYDADSSRGLRGGLWQGYSSKLIASYRSGNTPPVEDSYTGFRVASIPEPGSISLLLFAALGLLVCGCRKRRS